MKKIGMLLVLCSLGFLSVGCENAKAPNPTPQTPVTKDTKTSDNGKKTTTDTKELNPNGSTTETKSTTKTSEPPAKSATPDKTETPSK
jgi:hypothetical protein